MWSCEKEAALEDFQVTPTEAEIVARKAPPIAGAPTPPCGGCRLTITSASRNDAIIEVQSIIAGQLSDPPVPVYVCSSNTLWLSGTVNTANLPASIEFEEDEMVDGKKIQFRARTLNVPSIGFNYTISCSGSSTFGTITSNPATWPVNVTAGASTGWNFRFPLGVTNSSYGCALATVCATGPLSL